MQKEQLSDILELLGTIGEGLALLQSRQDAAAAQAVAQGRQTVTRQLDEELGQPLAQRISADALTDAEWLGAAYRIVEQLADPFQPQNAFDREFLRFLEYIWKTPEPVLLRQLKNTLTGWKKNPKSRPTYQGFVQYFERFPLWGSLHPERGDYDTLQRRAAVLKRHSYDFLWLYRRLDDYLSKRTLSAILINWAVLDIDYPQKVKSIFPDYWEPDIFPSNQEDVLVDVGAYIGDSIAQYVRMYGAGYKRIYAYEVSPDICETMRANVKKWGLHDVVIRNKGAGSQHGELFLSRSASDASANQLSADAAAGQRIEVVPLDEDLPEPVTFLKMDIEGAEWDTLLGCEKIIRRDRPKLAICVYHGYNDLWRIPALIESFCPDYEFYLRHYGGNLIPTEFVLLGRPRAEGAQQTETTKKQVQ